MVGLLILTVCVLLVMIMSSVVFDDKIMSDSGAKRVNVLINSIIAIVSMYIGAQIQKSKE